METIKTCPLGAVCEEIRDNRLYRCRWYTRVQGLDPNTGQEIDREDCAIAWLPTIGLEMARTNRGQTQALESFRNEVVDGNNQMLAVIQLARNTKHLAE